MEHGDGSKDGRLDMERNKTGIWRDVTGLRDGNDGKSSSRSSRPCDFPLCIVRTTLLRYFLWLQFLPDAYLGRDKCKHLVVTLSRVPVR